MAIAVGQRCVVRIQITDINLRNARDIVATVQSPQYVAHCQEVSFDEVSGLVYVAVDVKSAGSYSMWLKVRFAEEMFYTPSFVFAEVEGDAKPCDAPYIVDVEVSGESVSVAPPKIDVNAVTREEFEQLSKDIAEKVDKVEGKGLSTNDYTDADKKLVQTISSKADKEGYYSDMSVGMADNLVGRGDVQDAYINFRPSAGADNITDGAARIERIKGNSVVYNQLAQNADFRNGENKWVPTLFTFSQENDYVVLETTAKGSQQITQIFAERIPTNHKILIMCDNQRYTDASLPFMFDLRKAGASEFDTSIIPAYSSTQRRIISTIINTTAEIDSIRIYPIQQAEAGEKVIMYSIRVIDLTKMLGRGNEPTTVEEYNERKPMNIEDEYAYNEGELVDMHADTLVSTGDNAYDYTKGYARVMGGYKYDITANAGATLVVSFYADGEDSNEEREIAPDSEGKYTFPANGFCYVNSDIVLDSDICVCLNHSYDKPHPAYQQEVKDLGWIWEIEDSEGNQLFPKSMRSAGSAFDEIRFNPTKKVWEAVKRIGEVDLGSLEWGYESTSDYSCFVSKSLVDANENMICSLYSTINKTTSLKNIPDKSLKSHSSLLGYIYIVDKAYSNAKTFQQEMQGVTLYYELATPIITEIEGSENWNMDYRAWDFGSEEAIASVPSAPFRGDINYEPNAVDDLRWAVAEIRSLKAQLAQMSASVTNLTEE